MDYGLPGGSSEGIYLDNNSTTKAHPEVIEAVFAILSSGASNASSAHDRGAQARRILAAAREALAALCGSSAENIVFSSGATESNNVALRLSAFSEDGVIRRVVTSSIEHSSVLAPCELLEEKGVEVLRLQPDSEGRISAKAVEQAGLGPDTLVSLHWVNNETGVIQPVEEVAQITKAAGALLHIDAAQALGRLPVDFDSAGFDFMTVSAHKLHGPQGVGALVVRDKASIQPLSIGGGQEGGARPGTENLSGIAGFGVAAKLAAGNLASDMEQLCSLRDALEGGVLARVQGAVVNGGGAERVAGTTNIRFSGVDGQALVALLNQRGVYVSQSSACTNMRPEPSYVLREMGLSEEQAYESIRMCVSTDNTNAEVDDALTAIAEVVEALGGQVKEAEMKAPEVVGK